MVPSDLIPLSALAGLLPGKPRTRPPLAGTGLRARDS
jgi:hypothetical protein